MHFCVPSDRQLIWGGAIDKEQDLSQMKNPFFISQIHCYHGRTTCKWFCCRAWSHSHAWRESWHFVQSSYIINFPLPRLCQQISWDGSTWWWGRWFFITQGGEEWKEAKKGKAHLPKFALPQLFDGMMKDTKSFVSSLILYIYGRKAEFPSNELKILFAQSYIQEGKAQYWKNEAINLIAARQEPFKDFKDFIVQMEAQFGDPSPKATTIGKSKTLWQGSSLVDEYILQFKAKASQTNLGDTVLVEYLKARLNPVLFKSIYWLPVMPETWKEWYKWAQKLDWQYRQEQTELKLLGHAHMMHKPHKVIGGGHKRVQAQASAWAQPLANAVTPNVHMPQMHQQMHQHQLQNSNAMDVDWGGDILHSNAIAVEN